MAPKAFDMSGGANLVARVIRNAIRANRFAIETPIFTARQADSHESLDFPIDSRESCESIRANHATKGANLLPKFMPISFFRRVSRF